MKKKWIFYIDFIYGVLDGMWYLVFGLKLFFVLGIGEVIFWYLYFKGKFYIIVINVFKKIKFVYVLF